jgi:low affinity Fe/Cu permease
MKTLANLKKRLQALPERRKGNEQRALFDQFLSQATPAKDQLVAASNAVAYAAPVLPSTEYDVARQSVRSSARIAKNLAEKLREDANKISDRGTENSFVNLTAKAKEALKKATSGWQSALQAKIEKRETIAKVVDAIAKENLGIREQAKRLKSSVDSLRLAKDSLPRSPKDVASIEKHLKELTDAISKLGLDTPFGKFLQDAASEQGALLSDAEEEAVAQQIKSLKLTKVFRVRLSS